MSEYEEDTFMEQIAKWDTRDAKRNFLAKMEHKHKLSNRGRSLA